MDIWSWNAQDEEKFEYRPLCANDEIRLVKLVSGTFHDPINCTLVHTKLDSNPRYDALSYTWGNHQNMVSIKVNGKHLNITHNLATALRYLRRECAVTLWIDAICINQNDDDERTQQVALMTSIYQRARQVQIWLGPAADHSEMVMEFFEKFAQKSIGLVNQSLSESDSLEARIFGLTHALLKHSRTFLEYVVSWPAGEVDFPDEPAPTEGPNLIDDEMPTEELTLVEFQWLRRYITDERRVRLRRALEALLEREYWYRAWVVQEILMARSIGLKCGFRSVPWECVTTVVKAFMDSESHKLYGPTPWHSPLYSYERLATFETIGHLASVRLDEHSSRGPEWLLQMLLRLRHFRSKDPRDKVFSLLGLINRKLFQSTPSEPPILSVDYNLTFLQVSIRLFKYCVLAPSHSSIFENGISKSSASKLEGIARDLYKGSLNILCASQPTERPEGFPSWLPDFSRDNGMELWPCYKNDQYCRFVDARPSFSLQDTLIEVPGVVVTTLQQDHVTDKDDDIEANDDPCLLTRVWKFMVLAESQDSSALSSDAFWSALQLGKNSGEMVRNALDFRLCTTQTDKGSAGPLFEALQKGIQEDPIIAIESFLRNFRRGSLHRRFAMMRIGGEIWPAMIPADARPGDALHLLRGSDYPVLLRPVDGRNNNFEFVGPCCIPGWCVEKDPAHYGPVKRILLQ